MSYFLALSGCSTQDDEHSIQSTCSSSTCCGDIDEIKMGNYAVANNAWGTHRINQNDTYEQCITVNDSRASWFWQWPSGGNSLAKTYPAIYYGWTPKGRGGSPWRSTSLSPYLPALITDIGNIKVSFEAIVNATGTYNLAFDLWITNSVRPYNDNITHEVMIWVDKQNWDMPRNGERITIDNEIYYFAKNPNHVGCTPDKPCIYIIFWKEISIQQGSINISSFLRYLHQHGHIDSAKYLADIEFGTEVVSGSGTANIVTYSIEKY